MAKATELADALQGLVKEQAVATIQVSIENLPEALVTLYLRALVLAAEHALRERTSSAEVTDFLLSIAQRALEKNKVQKVERPGYS